MSFKSLLTDPSNRLASWKGENCCSWKGIECSSSGRVVVVNLRNPHPDEVMISINNQVISNSNNASDFALKGAISPLPNLRWLEGLRNLRYLVMTGVDLSKASESFHWAEPVSSLSNPILLRLSNCNISGRILIGQLLNLTSLSVLDMRSYILTSTIPDMFSNLTTLSVLDISGNDLDGHIPYLPQLEQLYVSNNPAMTIDLVSMFSASWSKLKFLDKSFTHVGGTLPPSLSNSTSLTFFQADGCSIQGSIPSSVTKLKKLRTLTLNDNNITGQLPVSMSSLMSLRYLSLIQNGLRGYIPTSICQILSLEYLNIEWNELTGRLPSCILQLPKLSYLSVNKNNLNGNVPLSLLQKSRLDLTSVVILILVNKSLSGAILYWLFNLPALSALDLPMNNFEGVIPPTIQMKSSLFPSIVNLARNKLQGHIPTQLENVNVIDLSLNNFVGSIPAQMGEIPAISLGSCKSLIYLSLGQNKLTGSIPEELERVTSLCCLDLNGNEFEGSFPTVIEKFQELEILNLAVGKSTIISLSRNKLSGPIPEKHEGLKKMTKTQNQTTILGYYYSLKFTGALLEIVTKGQMRFLVSVYSYNTGFDVSSNALTGKIPEKIGLLNGIPFLNLSHNNLTGLIPKLLAR
ncbi:hypothetical protein CQW23_13046 [Capsicum baccatum]|uniref:Leucine-rich repeat-containing N-terminal plant-type domain-containing protein n=1 Tax=Capsicum baccatum TaxID=33114 RepID=A0A2G2WUA3_CAPBA|nr:hypothetical protein CQW23_13046 [Capsicum baccatum]